MQACRPLAPLATFRMHALPLPCSDYPLEKALPYMAALGGDLTHLDVSPHYYCAGPDTFGLPCALALAKALPNLEGLNLLWGTTTSGGVLFALLTQLTRLGQLDLAARCSPAADLAAAAAAVQLQAQAGTRPNALKVHLCGRWLKPSAQRAKAAVERLLAGGGLGPAGVSVTVGKGLASRLVHTEYGDEYVFDYDSDDTEEGASEESGSSSDDSDDDEEEEEGGGSGEGSDEEDGQ